MTIRSIIKNKTLRLSFLAVIICVFGVFGVTHAVTRVFVQQGGTGIGKLATGTLMLGQTYDPFATTTYAIPTADGTSGYVLKTNGAGSVTWQADNNTGVGGTSAFWASSSDNLFIYPLNTNHVIVIGASATSATGYIFETVGNVKIGGNLNVSGTGHDDFSDFVANEHIDWTADQGATNIDSGNYTDTNTNANTICAGGTTYLDGEGACNDISSVYQPLESTLTDIADGTIAENLINTANPWADNEVSDTLTCSDLVAGSAVVDMSTETNLTGGRSLSMNSDSVDADTELYTDTKCIYFEDPTATDDFNSIWRNSTAGAYTITEIWAESDQTVTFMLQVDDGTPADVDSVDLAPASGEAEDTSLDGDTSLGVSEELDLAITSVSGTPTWVSICWTYTKDD